MTDTTKITLKLTELSSRTSGMLATVNRPSVVSLVTDGLPAGNCHWEECTVTYNLKLSKLFSRTSGVLAIVNRPSAVSLVMDGPPAGVAGNCVL